MTTRDTFGRDLSLWLREEGEHRVPDHLAEVLVRSCGHPPATVVVEPRKVAPTGYCRQSDDPSTFGRLRSSRWSSARSCLRQSPRSGSPASGLQRSNWRRTAGSSSLMARRSRATRPAVGTRRSCVDLPASATAPSISPDGRSIAYIMETLQRVDIVDIANGTSTTIPLSGVVGVGGPVSWSPDGTTVLFNTFDGQQEHLVTAKSDGTDVREIDTSTLSAGDPHRIVARRVVADRGSRRLRCRDGAGRRQGQLCTWPAPTALTCRRSDPSRSIDLFGLVVA